MTLPDLIVTHNTDHNRYYPGTPYRTFLLIYRIKSGVENLDYHDVQGLARLRHS